MVKKPKYSNECESNLRVVYDVATNKINNQNDANRSIDNKVGILFGFMGVISIGLIDVLISHKDLIGWNIFSFGVFLLMASIIIAAFAARSRIFHEPIDIHTVYSEKNLNSDSAELLNQLCSDIFDSYSKNQPIVTAKSYLFDIATFLLCAAVILLIVGIINLI